MLFAEDEFIDHINSERENYAFIDLVKWGKPTEGWRLFSDIEKECVDKPVFKRPESASEDDGLLLCYTSGTTGIPKGAVLSKAALYWNALNSIDMHDMNSEDLVLTTLPMFLVGGLIIQTLPALHLGATVVLMRRFDTDPFFELLANHPITLTLGVPTIMLAIMADSRWATTRAPTGGMSTSRVTAARRYLSSTRRLR